MDDTQIATDPTLGPLALLDTSHVSDALDKLGINGQCLGLLPLVRDSRLAGRAFTVRYVPVGTDRGTVGDYIDDLEPGTVVVLDNAGRLDATVWGDLLTATASRRQLAGTVIDGVCRDTDRAVELGYPVYSRSRWMRTGKDRVRVDGYNMPVTIGGVRVEPGDYLLGDADGVVVVPGRPRDRDHRHRPWHPGSRGQHPGRDQVGSVAGRRPPTVRLPPAADAGTGMSGQRHPADMDVAIVGGGPAGLTAAILLAQLGIEARVFERRGTTSRLPRAHLLNQRTMEIFESIGVAGDVYTMSPPQDNWHRVGWYTSLAGDLPGQGKEIGHLPAWGGGPDRDRYAAASPARYANLPQMRLDPLLRQHAEARCPGKAYFNRDVRAIRQRGGYVELDIAHTGSGAAETVTARYVIAADGGRLCSRLLGVQMIGPTQLLEHGHHAHDRGPEPIRLGRRSPPLLFH